MSEINLAQTITPITCPHCSNTVFVSFNFSLPMVNGAFNEGEVTLAKEEVRDKINKLEFTDEEKIDIEGWLAKPDTLLSRQDVDAVVQNMKNSHDSSTQSKAT